MVSEYDVWREKFDFSEAVFKSPDAYNGKTSKNRLARTKTKIPDFLFIKITSISRIP